VTPLPQCRPSTRESAIIVRSPPLYSHTPRPNLKIELRSLEGLGTPRQAVAPHRSRPQQIDNSHLRVGLRFDEVCALAPQARSLPSLLVRPVDRSAGFNTVLVYCVGCQHHNGRLMLADLPDWDWYDISAHLKCTASAKVGWVDTRLDWSEVIDFNKGIF
jgi:hypothetical protein